MDTVECRVDKVVFRSAENGFSILSCITDHDYITITGPMADVQPGVTLTVQGLPLIHISEPTRRS